MEEEVGVAAQVVVGLYSVILEPAREGEVAALAC
jgi:hypothetical protein